MVKWRREELSPEHEDSMCLVEAGYMIDHTFQENGNRNISMVYQPGDVFAVPSNWDDAPTREVMHAALANSALRLLPKVSFTRALRANREAEQLYYAQLEDRNGYLMERVGIMQHNHVYPRVALQLASLTRRFGRKREDNYLLPFPMSQEDVAGMVGTTRESASISLHQLKLQELIDYGHSRKPLVILDLDGLQAAG